jgi:nucleoside phosphorylase
MRRQPTGLASAVVLACLAFGPSGCGDASRPEPVFAILSAFPGELAAVLERAEVEETRAVEGRIFRLGRIGRTRVVMGMTGVALVNARETTRVLLDHFEVTGVVISGVAGSPLLVGDVTVPATWVLDDGSRYAAHAPWLELAKEVALARSVPLESCAIIPDVVPIPGVTPGQTVCFPYEPRVVVGGFGTSSDPFGGRAFECIPGGDDVFACDTDDPDAFPTDSVGPAAPAALVLVDADVQTAYDMETAAIAREVTSRGLPFVAFRASSDGGPDPFDLTDFVEFFAYYRLAAHNAAVAAAAFVERAR